MASTPTTVTVTPPSTPIMRSTILSDYINESWCELQFKSGCSSASSIRSHLHQSVNPEVLEKLLHEAQRETNYPSTSISVQSSPKTPQTPITEQAYNDYETNFNHLLLNGEINLNSQQSTSKSTLINSHNNSNKFSNSTLKNEDLTESLNENIKKDTDWIWYWSSRPQTQPPKEWSFIHPNSSLSRYSIRKHEIMDNKLLSRETINKLFFTHMASFILGATLMFLYLRKHYKIQLFPLN